MSIIKAPALHFGDTLAVIAPAGPPDPEKLDRGVRLFREAGFKIHFGRSVTLRNHYLAGNDVDRADDLNRCIENPDIQGILCARGGYGSMRILDRVNYDSIRENPKVVMGFSDVTALLLSIYRRTGLVTFHGPMPAGPHLSDWSFDILLRQITGTIRTGVPLVPPAETGSGTACFLNPPVAVVTEPILGGCLSILSTLSGTPWEPADQAFILFLEDIGEAPYRIDRMLTHMIHTRWIRSCRGIVLGDFIACDQRPDDPEPTPTVTEVLRERLQHLSLPVLKGFPVGHGVHNFTIPLGIPFSIRGDTLIQEESGVESLRRG